MEGVNELGMSIGSDRLPHRIQATFENPGSLARTRRPAKDEENAVFRQAPYEMPKDFEIELIGPLDVIEKDCERCGVGPVGHQT
jgi:hypothetical protein